MTKSQNTSFALASIGSYTRGLALFVLEIVEFSIQMHRQCICPL